MRYIILFILLWPSVCQADDFEPVMVCNAIGKAECGRDMKSCEYYYGIRSVHYESFEEARHICHNTVKHAMKDWKALGSRGDFIVFLGNRYCPTKGKLSKAEQRLNGNWIKNVKYWLKH